MSRSSTPDEKTANDLDAWACLFEGKVARREAVVAVVGLGYVGLPLALAFLEAGFAVIGLDTDAQKIAQLNATRSYIRHIPSIRLARCSHRFRVSTDFRNVAEADVIIICVPTPMTVHREPDLSYIVATAEQIGPSMQKGQLVVLESTTYPFTSEDILRTVLQRESGLVADRDFALSYSPEREDPANDSFDTRSTPKVVGADEPRVADMAIGLYRTVVDQVVRVRSMRVAEAVKLTENIFRAVNIALVNELKVIFDKMEIDVWEVIDAAATKPFGFMPFYPGPGIGGHCIPIDPFYLTWKAREFGISTRFIELAGEVNSHMPDYVVQRTIDALNDRHGRALKGARLLIVGMAYKRNVDDMRESPSIALVERFRAKGAHVEYYDPFVPEVPDLRDHRSLVGMTSVVWQREPLSAFDVAVIATDHSNVDYRLLLETVPLVVDTRNALRHETGEFRHKIVKA